MSIGRTASLLATMLLVGGLAGLFYLALTVPLTHLINYIDARLRRGRPPEPEDPLSPLNPEAGQELI